MTDDHQGDVAIARIEATLAGIKNQIDYSERSSAQLVKLVDERFTARFDSLERRLDTMDASRETARVEQAKQFDEMEKRIELAAKNAADRADAVADKAAARAEIIEARLSNVERFNARLIGAIVGSAGLTGTIVAGVVKAMG